MESTETKKPLSLQDMEKRAIREALEAHNNNRIRAAKQLGIDPSTLHRKLKRYHLK